MGPASEHMVDPPEQRVGDGHDGLLVTAMAQPPIARGKGAALGACRRPSGLDQRAAQGAIALASTARASFAGALVIARTQPAPAGPLAGRGEHGMSTPISANTRSSVR